MSARRRASVYVAVLGVAALVTVLGVGGLAASRAIARSAQVARDAAAARTASSSALELARAALASNSRWRTVYTNGTWFSSLSIAGARVDVQGVNPNGSIDRSHTDPVDLTATATIGKARHAATVRLVAKAVPLTCLGASLASGGAITVTSGTIHARNTTVAANGAFTAVLATVNANVEAGLTAIGVTVNGTVRSLAGTRTFPGADLLDIYSRQGSSIPITAFPLRSGVRSIYATVLSPAVNPFNGATNTSGIYLIDAGGGAFTIESCRVVGTLIITNATTVTLRGCVVLEPAVADYPVLIIRGNASFATTTGTLSETLLAYNFNPTGSAYPYSLGLSNATQTDTYTSAINGLTHVSGNASISGTIQINQLVVDGNTDVTGTLTLSPVSTYRRSPPPGFASVRMVPSPGTWKQVTQ